ncbi:helicase-exonuclease AddAB subunit AddA [Bacillus kwashiorkori]|uniref:helicase-exonuclease AddAB subunit AddA n=1 Tax=Bacillus kwashiorkori TaxID=1522318 RepID=UPI000781B677|nr:helicase-exonuclease AddAB subunit AddA [Bacillus kwashiorkori]
MTENSQPQPQKNKKGVIPEKPADVTWTNEQWQAIYAKGQDTLVAAAAGSGKTAVLVERIIQKIIDEVDPLHVDELLVVTFTNAAAAEMRNRIGQAIEKEIKKRPDSHHLRQQLSLLNRASISTLHAFCLNVIRNYYYLTNIDPSFRILDDTEGILLRDEVIEELLEEEYSKENNEAFFQLVDIFTSDRSDHQLQDLIIKMHEFSQANPIPKGWLEELVNTYNIPDTMSVDELPFVDPLLFDLELRLKEARRLFQEALEKTTEPGGPAPRAENFINDIRMIDELLFAKQQSFSALYEKFQMLQFQRLNRCSGDEYIRELVDQATNLRDRGKKIVTVIKDQLFSRKPETFLKDLREMKPHVTTLVRLVILFSEKYKALKQEKGVVDFSDLEHLTLQILSKYDKEANVLIQTEAAVQYQRQFKEVLVDEYQDTNMVQEAIIQLVKRGTEEDGNLFMVGDVKQSIYRFRLAEPKLFLQKYLRFNNLNDNAGLRIDLAKNFRSRKEVLAGTNFIFRQIMGEEVGEINYDTAAALKKGASYPEEDRYPIELAIIYKGQDEDDYSNQDEEELDEEEQDLFSKEELEQSQMESKFVAKKIRELIDTEKQIFDPKTGTYRTIEYRDIVILFRSFTWAGQFLEELKNHGIPAYANISSGYFEAAEVATMVALLKIIDNPYQDIPLVSVLRSPVGKLTDEELAQIRINGKGQTFYEVVKTYLQHNDSQEITEKIQWKLRRFIEQLNSWRQLARRSALSELIWQLYRDTKFYDYVGGLPGGKQRQANLRALYDRARAYESTSFRGLFRFLRFIERMRNRGEDLGAAKALGEQENVVRIMTIHSSKGLEFPVVFVAGLARQFNMMDLRKPYLFDKEYGFAMNYINPEKQITYPSLIQLAVTQKKRQELIAEEMRVLYVALTRAKEKLYLIGSTKDKDKLIEGWQQHLKNDNWLLSNYHLLYSKNYLDWIAPAIIRHPDGGTIRLNNGSVVVPQDIWQDESIWKVQLISEMEVITEELADEEADMEILDYVKKLQPVPFTSNLNESVLAQLTWKYPYEAATIHRSKQSVSEIKRLKEIRDAESGDDFVRSFKKPIVTRPKFMQQKTISPAEKGTAMHMVMQHIDLSRPITLETIESTLFYMQEQELLTSDEANIIDIQGILRFFESEIGFRVKYAKWIRRELPFSFTIAPDEIYPNWQEGTEKIFVQGIIDCLLKDEDGFVLLDYKTDDITNRFQNDFSRAAPILKSRYLTQIRLYKQAIEEIYHEPLTEIYLYFFDGGHLLAMDL